MEQNMKSQLEDLEATLQQHWEQTENPKQEPENDSSPSMDGLLQRLESKEYAPRFPYPSGRNAKRNKPRQPGEGFAGKSSNGKQSLRRELFVLEVLKDLNENGFELLADSAKYTDELVERFGVAKSTAYLYIRAAIDSMKQDSIEASSQMKLQHVLDYQEIKQFCMLEGRYETAIKAMQAIENLKQWNKPTTNAINISINTEEDRWKGYSIEDIKLLTEIERRRDTQAPQDAKADLGHGIIDITATVPTAIQDDADRDTLPTE